ncbi:hypothetical protein QJQ45_021840, partial [Haematococcus lacustris]
MPLAADLDSSPGARFWVPRVNLCFAAEDPFVFAQRHAEAHASRLRAESLLRYHLYVDSMPVEDLAPLTTEQVNRMLGYALNSKRLKDRLMDTSQLIGEVNVDYTRTMNKMTFDAALRRGHSGCAAPLVALTEQFQQEEPKPAPLKGCVPVAEYDYPHQFSEYSFRTLLTKPEVISALARIRVECAKVLKMSLFNLHYTKSLRLDEFEQGQSQNTDQVGNYLKDTWSVALKNAIKSSFKDVGKGWYNLHEANMETYEFSKLKKFLTLTRFVMEDTLRFLLEESLTKYVAFITAACSTKVRVVSTCLVESDSPAAGSGPPRVSAPRKPPLLLLELQVSKDGSRLHYSAPLAAIITKATAVFDHAVTK